MLVFIAFLCFQCSLLSAAVNAALEYQDQYQYDQSIDESPGRLFNNEKSPPSVYPVEEHIFHATIDHYNFRPTIPYRTFPLRYYVNQDYWFRGNKNQSGGPILFYAGNEANIFQFINNTGFMFEVAKELNGMVVFAEHRYYGLSNPFGSPQYALGVPYNVSFLTVEQAMNDYNTLSIHIREQWNVSQSIPFIVFGGSYGANIALWLRLKNPNLWAGAIASSATPLKHILRETNQFTRIETDVYANVSSKCPDLIRQGWNELYNGVQTAQGRIDIARSLGICHPLPDVEAAYDVHGWISDALETMVQYGYPYPTNYYNPVPGYPFKVACERMVEVSDEDHPKSTTITNTSALQAIKAAIDVYYNYTGQAGLCYDFDDHIIDNTRQFWIRKGQRHRLLELSRRRMQRKFRRSDQHMQQPQERRQARQIKRVYDDDSDHTMMAWGYQTCTEVYQPMPTDGVTDFEVPYVPNSTAYYEDCRTNWGGVEPRPNWEEMTFMGSDIGACGSNIFLTNGQLDPWRAAGIQSTPKGTRIDGDGSPVIIVRNLKNAAHHLDLRESHPLDPSSVTAVRKEQIRAIQKWSQEWEQIHSP